MKNKLFDVFNTSEERRVLVAYESICSQFDDEVFEAENVQQSFDAAKDYLTVVRELKNMRVQHPLTETIGELTKKSSNSSSLRGRVTYF